MTDFHDVRFPLNLAFGARGGPVRSVDILDLANGAEVRNARGRHSRREYNAAAGIKSREEAIELLHFFESRRGPLHGFRFRDPLDYDAETVLGIGDGRQTEFALTKAYGTEPQDYIRRITKPVEGTVRVRVDDVETSVSVDHVRGIIQVATPPKIGAIISANFEFDVPVRFAAEALDIVLDDFGATEIQNIPLIEILQYEGTSHE
jgi:uncharacterized protein (TIGR02217 family)